MIKDLRYLLFVLVVLLAIFSCSQEIKEDSQYELEADYTFEQIKQKVENELRQGKVFNWQNQSTDLIFSAGMLSDSTFSIGYTISPTFDLEANVHLIDLESENWKKARYTLENLIVDAESKAVGRDLTIRDIQPHGYVKNFPQIIITTSNKELLEILRDHDLVRYVEPLGFNISDYVVSERSSSGCNDDPNYSIDVNDYTTVNPTAKVPWNFYDHNINLAWNNSAKGDNVKVAIIDTGASDNQDNLGSNFNSGNSVNRTVQRVSTKYSGRWWWRSLDPPHDPCGHGTSMAGLASGPWSNDGNSVGAAYLSDLISIRAVEDVIISTSNEREGVRDALYLAANDGSVKVISMSIGSPFYSSTVADGVFYAYNQQKLIFAAAGTSLPWLNWYPVIFPANMSQCRAVTGVKDSPNLAECETCHTGPEVDFVIAMERASNDDRTSLSLAGYSNQPKYIGGSSAATATTAGIAAMVWSENLSSSRTTVLNALKLSSSIFPNRHPDFGWGLIDAQQAVNGN